METALIPKIISYPVALGISILFTLSIIDLAKKLKLFDASNSLKRHLEKVSSLGGIAIFAAFWHHTGLLASIDHQNGMDGTALNRRTPWRGLCWFSKTCFAKNGRKSVFLDIIRRCRPQNGQNGPLRERKERSRSTNRMVPACAWTRWPLKPWAVPETRNERIGSRNHAILGRFEDGPGRK